MKNKSLKIKYLINLDNYISSKDNMLLFLFIVMAVMPPILSGFQTSNLWDRLLTTIQNPITNVLFFSGLTIIIVNVKKNICYNEIFFSRFHNYKDLIITGVITVFVATLIYFIAFIILAIAGSTIFSIGNYKVITYEKYNISIFLYILFILIKNGTTYIMISIILFLLSFLIKKKLIKHILLLFILLLFFIPYNNITITHFYQILIPFQGYILNSNYATLYIEIIDSILYIILLFVGILELFQLCKKRKIGLE